MRGLLQHWTKSSIILTSKEESVWRNKKALKQDRFLRGRQIAYLIYKYFRVTGANDSVENYADLFTISLRNDDIQESDSKWDGILLSMTKIPPDDILEGLYKLRIRESEKLKTVLELYDLETHQKKLGPDYHILKTMVKRSIEQNLRIKNFACARAVVSISKMLTVICLEEMNLCEGCMHLMVCQWRPRQMAEVRSLQSHLHNVKGRSASGDRIILPLSSMSEVLGMKTVLLSAKWSGTVPPSKRALLALKRNFEPRFPAHW